MERLVNAVPGPIRRFISRGLSFPTLPRLSSSDNTNGADQSPLPSAGKRRREDSDDETDGVSPKRVKMDVDSPAPAGLATPGPESPSAVEQIRPGVEAMTLGASGTPEPTNGSAVGKVEASPGSPSKRTKYQRGLRGTRKSAPGDAAASASTTPSKPRLGPKRQCALLIGFCGTGYSGMQIQKDANTIEGNLFDALVKVGAVSEDNSDDPTKVNIQRAARTDAGVHAARNTVSIKIIIDLPGVTDLVGLLNAHLPPQIRVWDIVRTQNSFNSRTSCDSRKYTYFLPTYMLLPPAPDSVSGRTLRESADAYDSAQHPFWVGVSGQEITPETTLFMLRRKWRIDSETLTRFRAILQAFTGTHNFWNFTIGREYKEAASKRHIKSIEVEEPAIYGNTEWLSVQIHGQSFMLHQIRKMIGLAVLLARSQGAPSLVDYLYTNNRVRIPKSPALGLLLEEPVFETYNKKIVAANAKFKEAASAEGKETEDDGESSGQNLIREPMDFDKHKEAIEKFKKEHIYEAMRTTEDEQGTFDAWLTSIDNHEARLFYELRGRPVPSELAGSKVKAAAAAAVGKDDGDESDDALGKGKVNYKSVELEG